MKVLQVTTHMNIGGIAQYVASLARALKVKGVEPIIASSGGDFVEELARDGIKHTSLDIKTKSEVSPKIIKSILTLNAFVKKEGIDLIHAHTRVSQVVSFFVSRATGIPYVTTCHGFFKRRLWRMFFDTWGVKAIAISDSVKQHLREDFSVSEDRIALIYNGVDIKRFLHIYGREEKERFKRSLGLGNGPVIGTLGRLSPVKGQRFLIQAMSSVIAQKNDVQCLIVGTGPEEASLKGMAKSLGIEAALHFSSAPGAEIPKILALMDIFVFPSLKEGLGLALLEALAAGKPCIASRVGGIGDVIEDGVNGVLTPAGDARAIEDALLRLLNNESLCETMGRNGRSLAQEKFSLDYMADKVIALYKEVLHG